MKAKSATPAFLAAKDYVESIRDVLSRLDQLAKNKIVRSDQTCQRSSIMRSRTKVRALADLCLIVPSSNMQNIVDAHLCGMHAIFTALRHRVAQPDAE